MITLGESTRFSSNNEGEISPVMQVHLIGYTLIGQIVLAGQLQAQISRSYNAVMMLDDDFIQITSKSLSLDPTLIVSVLHGDGEVHAVVNVLHAGHGTALGIHLTIKQG